MKISRNLIHGHVLRGMEFSIGDSAFAKVDSKWEWPGVSVPFNRLYMVKSGSALLWSREREYKLEPGMAYLLPAGLPCAYKCPDQMEKLYFHFNYLCLDRYDIFWGTDQIGVLPIPDGLFETMRTALARNDLIDTLTIQQGILALATAFMREGGLGRSTAVSYSLLVSDTIAYIRKHLSSQLRIDQLATQEFVSNTHLRNKFRQETGITLGRYIDEQVMLEAQRLLCQTEDSIGTIARSLGFCDQFYFSTRFSKLCGISPQAYRQRTKQICPGPAERLKK